MKKSVAAFLIALGFILHGVSAEKRNPLMAKEPLVGRELIIRWSISIFAQTRCSRTTSAVPSGLEVLISTRSQA